MSLRRHPRTALALGVALGVTLTAAGATAGGTSLATAKPVIARPVTVPRQPLAGQRFTVSFKVTRSDTGTPLRRGTMVCDPSVAGRVIRHVESFRGGVARLSFGVPANAAGKLLKVKVTIKTAGQSATRVATFKVASATAPSLSMVDASVAEGNAGTATLAFPIRLSPRSAKPVSVSYATTDGTAKEPADYRRSSGTLTFAPGETAKTISIEIVGDIAVEQDELFTVKLFSAVNADLATTSATVTITNDDSGQPVTVGNYKGETEEGNFVFFSVLSSRQVSGFRVNALPCRCRPGGGWLRGGEDLGDTVISIRPNGTFTAQMSWKGSQVEGDIEWTSRFLKVVGSFPTATTVKGTIAAIYEFNSDGAHYICNSRVIDWSATLQG